MATTPHLPRTPDRVAVAVRAVPDDGGATDAAHCSGLSLAERRVAIESAVAGLRGLGDVLYQAGSAELVEVVGQLDELVALAGAGRFTAVAEAHERGVMAESDAPSVAAWITAHAQTTRQGGSGSLAGAVRHLSLPANAALREAVEDGRLTIPVARTVVAEIARIESRLVEGARETVLAAMIAMGVEHGSSGVRTIRPELLARHGLPDELEREQDRLRRGRALTRPVVDDGLHEYRLVLDPEGAAVLESAIDALSAPAPTEDPETGVTEPDLRSSDQRRADALVEVVRAAVASMDTRAGRGARAALMLTMSYDDLSEAVDAGRTLGGLDGGMVLAPETVRRLACDGDVLPVVLGSDGEVLDVGRAVRFFSAAQTRALWLRDGGCTYPGCSTPARWTHAHHLVHWVDGGVTDLGNAALLCGRHHTIVHSRRLHGYVDTTGPPGVVWDTTPGSYERVVAQVRRAG